MSEEITSKDFKVVRSATAKEKAQTPEGKKKSKQRSVKQAFLEAGKPNAAVALSPSELALADPSSLNSDQLSQLLRTAPTEQLKKIAGLKNIVNDAITQSKQNKTSVKKELEKKAQLAAKGVIKVQEKNLER